MSDVLSRLAEANIRDYERRRAAGETMPSPAQTLGDVESLEAQRLREVRALLEEAAATSDPDARAAALARAHELETQLLIGLEAHGLRLLARRFAAELAALRRQVR